jgi:hypothetical protein
LVELAVREVFEFLELLTYVFKSLLFELPYESLQAQVFGLPGNQLSLDGLADFFYFSVVGVRKRRKSNLVGAMPRLFVNRVSAARLIL